MNTKPARVRLLSVGIAALLVCACRPTREGGTKVKRLPAEDRCASSSGRDAVGREKTLDDHIDISLHSDGRILVGDEQYSLESLRELLTRRAKLAKKDEDKLPRLSVRIRASSDLEYARVQRVMVLCLRVSIWRLSFDVLPASRSNDAAPADAEAL